MIVSEQTLALIRLATNAGASPEEARTAAMTACRQLVNEGILRDGGSLGFEEDDKPPPPPPPQRGTYAGGQTHFSDMGDFFSRAGRAAASAHEAADREEEKRRARQTREKKGGG